MKKYYFLLGATLLHSGVIFAETKPVAPAAPNPATQQWVLQQLQILQNEIQSTISASAALSNSDWLGLCQSSQSIDSSSGCTPNCQGAQSAACTKLLNRTEIEDQTILSSTAATGLSVFRLTIDPSFTNQAPTITNGSSDNYIRCQTYTARGTLLNNLNDNFLLGSSSTQENYQQYTAGVDLSPNTFSTSNQLLANAPNSGAQRLNQQYYVVCMAYTISSNVATNVNMDSTLSITWS